MKLKVNRAVLGKKLRSLKKVGQSFEVKNSAERVAVNQLAKDFFRCGVMDLRVVTRELVNGKFIVIAIP